MITKIIGIYYQKNQNLLGFWGSPGKKINQKVQSAHEILSNQPKSENFVVLNFEIDSVDLLKLEQPVHKRYFWEKSKKWEKVEINP